MFFRRRALQAAAVALVVATGLSGCGSSKDATGANSSTVKPGAGQAANGDVAQRYFEAVVTNDPEVQADALEYAAPDSPAAVYLTYLADSASAFKAGGKPRAADTLAVENGVYRVCFEGGKDCLDYGAVTLADGKVDNFTVGGAQVSARAAVGDGKVAPLGDLGTVEFLSRNVSSASNAFVVNLHVTSGDRPITLQNDVAVYRQANGKRFRAVQVAGPSTLAANSGTNVLLIFAGVEPGPGALDYAVVDPDGTQKAITLRTF